MKVNIQNKIKLDPSWPVPISLQNNTLLIYSMHNRFICIQSGVCRIQYYVDIY